MKLEEKLEKTSNVYDANDGGLDAHDLRNVEESIYIQAPLREYIYHPNGVKSEKRFQRGMLMSWPERLPEEVADHPRNTVSRRPPKTNAIAELTRSLLFPS